LAARDLARLNLSFGGFEFIIDKQTTLGLLALRPGIETAIARQLSDAENNRLRELYRRVMPEVYPQPLWEAVMSEVYMRHLTLDDIEGILDFYETPAGSKLVRLHSTFQHETAEAGEILVQTHRTEFARRVGFDFRKVFQRLVERHPSVLKSFD
jgi:hypothetical protein